jgi:CheY-like chemotaxis protein
MTEKLPRRLSRHVVVSGSALPAGSTRALSSSAARASPSPVSAISSAASSAAVADLDATRLDPSAFDELSMDSDDADATAIEIIGADAVALTAASSRPNALDGNHRPRALVVDDDPEIRRALARLLRPELDVYLAESVARAEALLARLDRVDVAFIDWELPDGTGEQILERLAHWPDAIRVLISARVVSSENPLKNRALANLVLGKPIARGVVESLKRAALALPQG